MTDYTVVYARRRTLAVYIRPDGGVEVRAPHGLARGRIQTFVDQKADWIARKRAEVLDRAQARERTTLGEGTPVSLLGREYRIALVPPQGNRRAKPALLGEQILLPQGNQEELQTGLTDLCRRLMKDYLPGRVERLAGEWGFRYGGVSVTGARTRWGSCSGKNRLNFSCRLCFASPQAVDYVILHELAHTREHNHSPRFWHLVEERMPDYPRREEELKELQQRLYRYKL